MALTGNEIRQKFLDYFKAQGHTVVNSSSLVPKDDPSLLFTNAGMVQFKQVFVGQEKRDYQRAATCQKCFRASGKHNDLENVGRTPRHHTFFEMLGNFSFGDYFKKDAVRFGWQLLTEGFGLDPERLWVSVHESDDEAESLWQSEVGVRKERIVRLGDEENFWAMGDTGPCGPCSEIHIDQGPEVGCGRPDCAVGCDCDRYLELWNLVFMQYNRDAAGKMTPLPKPSIDTGMGLERIAATVQGKLSNYDSDLFTPILARAGELAGQAYGQAAESDVSLRVIADHARACAFLVADGVMPKNEGRGYVLRRILRRAARHGRKLGIEKPFLHLVSQTVMDEMVQVYPQFKDSRAFVDKVIHTEEERFGETLDTGLKLLSDAMGEAKAKGASELSGQVAFKLYDTYGFPLDLTQTICQEEGLGVDEAGFQSAMEGQRTRSRAAWKGSGEEELPPALARLKAGGFQTGFTGYEGLSAASQAAALLVEGEEVDAVGQGQEAELVAPKTPFYGAAGGQVGDVGEIKGPEGRAVVRDTMKPGGEMIVHRIKVTGGVIKKGDAIELLVDHRARAATAANHTATHLLHAALRAVLGEHVKQAGSMVSPQRLRFDFSHFEALTPEQLGDIERRVNEGVRANIALETQVMDLEEAMATGAMALFEERYGNRVRLVQIPGVSKELCGGTHCNRTGDIGLFKLVSESSVAAGVRRVEALTGAAAVEAMQAVDEELNKTAAQLKAPRSEASAKAAALQAQLKQARSEIEALKVKLASGGGGRDLLSEAKEIAGVKVIAAQVEADTPKALREAADNLRDRLGSGVAVLGAAVEGKAMLLALVTKDLVKRFHAGNLVKVLAPLVGGGGGGRPDMAQAGGQNPEGLEAALARVPELVEEQAKS
ncbi:alanyl-tRNA synthetase [Desulfocarbo indianensis]|nr:alanyl-tRNA synthetase [Desulfocarbo indianensis]